MWLSNKRQWTQTEEANIQVGTVTIGGADSSVYLAGEHRNVALFSPGGYHWIPARQDAVLVVKTGEEEAPGIVGCSSETDRYLKPGEVWISVSGESGIHLRENGVIDLVGTIHLNGHPLVMSGEGG